MAWILHVGFVCSNFLFLAPLNTVSCFATRVVHTGHHNETHHPILPSTSVLERASQALHQSQLLLGVNRPSPESAKMSMGLSSGGTLPLATSWLKHAATHLIATTSTRDVSNTMAAASKSKDTAVVDAMRGCLENVISILGPVATSPSFPEPERYKDTTQSHSSAWLSLCLSSSSPTSLSICHSHNDSFPLFNQDDTFPVSSSPSLPPSLPESTH